MTSPYAAGGGGSHLESRITASYLTAVLCEAGARGLPGNAATSVRTQRADFGDLLDDIVVNGTYDDGSDSLLHLQIKNSLTFTAKDDDWVDVLQRAWDTFTKDGFDPTRHRIGVGIGTYSARADQHYQSVLNWAEHSVDASHFFERIAKKDYSHKDKQGFVTDIRKVLEAHASGSPSDDAVWRFLKSFVIIHFDFQSPAGSRDAAKSLSQK